MHKYISSHAFGTVPRYRFMKKPNKEKGKKIKNNKKKL